MTIPPQLTLMMDRCIQMQEAGNTNTERATSTRRVIDTETEIGTEMKAHRTVTESIAESQEIV
jgi:hypothetical protein